MPRLLPTRPAPGPLPTNPAARSRPVLYPASYAWDWDRGDFVRDARGRTVRVDGYTAWLQWCVKTVMTQRYAYLAYGPYHGVEFDTIEGILNRTIAESRLARSITEALLMDPRTGNVSAFAFMWVGDEISVGFTVTPTVGPPRKLRVRVPTGDGG